jgi:hypothetical protein
MQRLFGSTTNNRKEYQSNIMCCASRRDFRKIKRSNGRNKETFDMHALKMLWRSSELYVCISFL